MKNLAEIKNRLDKDSGITFNPFTFEEPKKGYAVALQGFEVATSYYNLDRKIYP